MSLSNASFSYSNLISLAKVRKKNRFTCKKFGFLLANSYLCSRD